MAKSGHRERWRGVSEERVMLAMERTIGGEFCQM
jgi:hypothetical protein